MNKTEYLADLQAKSYIQEVATEELQKDYTELNLKVYVVELLEKVNSTKAQPVKHRFCVYKEGFAQETAFAAGSGYTPFYNENNSTYQSIVGYITGTIPNVKAYWIKEFDKTQNYAKVRCDVFVTDHIEEKWYLIWNDSGLTHEEITVLV